MSKTESFVRIVYKFLPTGELSVLSMPCVDVEHAKKIAKKLRPRHSKIVSVNLETKVNLP